MKKNLSLLLGLFILFLSIVPLTSQVQETDSKKSPSSTFIFDFDQDSQKQKQQFPSSELPMEIEQEQPWVISKIHSFSSHLFEHSIKNNPLYKEQFILSSYLADLFVPPDFFYFLS